MADTKLGWKVANNLLSAEELDEMFKESEEQLQEEDEKTNN